MKKILYSALLAGLALFSGCTEDENLTYISANPEKPVLQLPENGEAYIISEATGENNIAFKWSSADFGVPTEVTYKLQADKDGGDFSDPIDLGETTSNFISLKSSDLNGMLTRADFETELPVTVLLRITASVSSNIAAIVSEVIETSFTLYKLADPNDDGSRIYMVGAAVPAGWNPGDAVEMVNIAPDVYRATTTFAVDRFRFLGQKDWGPISYNFPFFTGDVSPLFENARQDDREDGDENIWFKGTPGEYTITVNLATKSITMDAPLVDDGSKIYIVGAAVPAEWNPADAVEMVNIAPNVYRATTTFLVDRFRFLGQLDWGPVSYNFPFFTGDISSNLENARQDDRDDGDENLWFKGEPGVYEITVNLEAKTITMKSVTVDDGSRIYIVGAAVPAGWNPADAVEMVNIAPNVYRASTTFSVERFRFLGQLDWGPVSYNFPFFTGDVSSDFENARQDDREDGDENLWFKGTPGDYTITVNLDSKSITIK